MVARERETSPTGLRRARRVLIGACLVALCPAVVSYAATMFGPSNSSLGIRSVEWLRDHGAAGLVIRVEDIYYTLNAPAKGGPPLRVLPQAGIAQPVGGSRAAGAPRPVGGRRAAGAPRPVGGSRTAGASRPLGAGAGTARPAAGGQVAAAEPARVRQGAAAAPGPPPASSAPAARATRGSTPAGRTSAAGARLALPAPIQALTAPSLPGEGVWHPTQVNETLTNPPLLVTSFRSDPADYPRLVAGVAWINTARASVTLYAGRLEPSVVLPSRGPMEVPPSDRTRLLATFNSGFKLADSHGGWALYGHTYAPLVNDQATFVRYAGGGYDVTTWHGGPQAGLAVVFARQNLALIVDHGRPAPNLGDGARWGATVGNAIQVWRSGIGVDAHGNLIYAAADYQTVGSLAQILIRAGAVRAMELDINSYWVTFVSYANLGAQDPSSLLPDMVRPDTRYLSPDDRDFFAVYLR